MLQERLQAEQRKEQEKRIMEERRKQEEKRQQEEQKRLEEQRRKEELFRQEEFKRQEEQRKQQELKRRMEEEKRLAEEKKKKEEEERKRKEEEQRLLLIEKLKKEEEARQQEKQRMLEQTRRLEEQRLEQERLRLEEQNREFQRLQELRNQEFLRQQQEFHHNFSNPYNMPPTNAKGLVGHVEDQLSSLFGKSNADQQKEHFKKGPPSPSHRQARPGSPKSEKKHPPSQEQIVKPSFYPVPSATPADQLPGHPTRDLKRQSHESHDVKGRDTPLSVAGSDVSHNSAPSGIPNELLEYVNDTANLPVPVWKPPDKTAETPTSASFSPAKSIHSPSKPAPVSTDRDSSFDDLVRHIDSSPSQKDQSSSVPVLQTRQIKHLSNDHASASETERSDYDNDLGGVDYDDPDEDYPRKLPQKKVPCYSKDTSSPVESTKKEETRTKRGTTVPCYAEKTEDEFDAAVKGKSSVVLTKQVNNKSQKSRPGRVFGNRKGLKIDQKAIEKVHKNLAGTDFDFEDEFDDDVEASPKPDIKSLKGFREQTKKAPIYMKETEQIPPVPDMDEPEDPFDIIEKPTIKVRNPGRNKFKKLPEQNMDPVVEVPKISVKKLLKNRAEEDVEEILEKVEKKGKKVPTLKIKIGNRTESPVSGFDGDEIESKRRSSIDKSKDRTEERVKSLESEEVTNNIPKIPKLTIKIGGLKPETDTSIKTDLKDDFNGDPPQLIIKTGTTPTSSPRSQRRTPTHTSKPGTPARDKLSTSELALENIKVRNSPKTSSTSTSSPANRTKESLAKADQSDTNADFQKIFGTGEPLPVSVMGDAQRSNSDKSEEGPSELELLALELENQLAKEKQLKQQAERDSKRKDDGSYDDFETENSMHHDPKYKFKQLKQPSHGDGARNTTSPNPPTPVKLNLAQNSGAGAASRFMNRKKELLNQYYGIEAPVAPTPAPATNGPSQIVEPAPISQSIPSTQRSLTREPPVRNIIKMPKAVASVTSVPTRADYQQQLEANLERKRKREGKDPDYKKGKGNKGGKGNKKNVGDDAYKPKIKTSYDDPETEVEANKEQRKTRGKPPKKCLADSPEREDLGGSFIENNKKESIKYAEEILKSFDMDEEKPERRRKDKKKRRRDNEDEMSQPNTKTPRIVIKFSKNKDPPTKNPPDNNGLIKPPGVSDGPSLKLPKLKIKNLIEPTST